MASTRNPGRVAAHEWLFRIGIVSDVLAAVVLIFLTHAFYRSFKDVDQYALMIVQCPAFLSVFDKRSEMRWPCCCSGLPS
jgi:hypothetical protein